MMAFFANMFGYLLNALYSIFQNYGIAIIIFSVIVKLIILPISIKQQKTMKKTSKLQGKLKEIQNKYKNDPEKLNQETLALYKTENMSPFSGCLSAIIQIVLLLSVFFLVKSPLTHMKKVDPQIIENYKTQITQDGDKSAYPEIAIIEKMGKEDETVNINMNFLGLNLSSVPTQSLKDPKVYIIPILYIISSFISIKLSTQIQSKSKSTNNVIEVNGKDDQEKDPMEAVTQANKSMSYILPVMSVSIALVAPLGLALYWLVNNILMIVERIILNKFITDREEQQDA